MGGFCWSCQWSPVHGHNSPMYQYVSGMVKVTPGLCGPAEMAFAMPTLVISNSSPMSLNWQRPQSVAESPPSSPSMAIVVNFTFVAWVLTVANHVTSWAAKLGQPGGQFPGTTQLAWSIGQSPAELWSSLSSAQLHLDKSCPLHPGFKPSLGPPRRSSW